jgi:hypothetical protein
VARSSHRAGFDARVGPDGIEATFHGAPGARDTTWTARWADVVSFSRIQYRDGWLRDHEVYLLLTEGSVLFWEKPPLIPYSDPNFEARLTAARAAADILVEQIQLRAPTMLIDASKVVDAPALGPALLRYAPEPDAVRAALHLPRIAHWWQRFGWILPVVLITMSVGTLAAVYAIVQPFK